MSKAMMGFLLATSVMFAVVIAYPQWAWAAVVIWLAAGVYAAGEESEL